MQGVPAEPAPEFVDPLDKQAIYYGEKLGGYAITGAPPRGRLPDKNIRGDGLQQGRRWSEDGFRLPSRHVRLRFGQIDPLISSYITSNSRVLYVRDIRERVEKMPRSFDGQRSYRSCPTATSCT